MKKDFSNRLSQTRSFNVNPEQYDTNFIAAEILLKAIGVPQNKDLYWQEKNRPAVGGHVVMENVSMLKSSVHRFYLEEDDVALGIKDMNMTVDKIELLSHQFNLAIFDCATTKEDFEARSKKQEARSKKQEAIINNQQFITQYQWSQKRYRLFNSIYKVAAQKTDKEEGKKTQHEKLLERIAKHKTQKTMN